MATRYAQQKAEQEELEKITFNESMLALGATFVGASALSAIAYRFSPGYRSTPISAKTAFILAPTLGAFYVRGEQVGTEFRRNKFIKHLDPAEREEMERRRNALESRRTMMDRSIEFVNAKRWSILGYTWLTGMASAAYYLYRKKGMTVPQKIVQARMYAQLITIVGILSTAAIASLGDKTNDRHVNRNSAELDAILAQDTRIPIQEKAPLQDAADKK
ncbi:Replication factor C, subunit RFC4 [Coemansia erecta]|nr:Replication factor C, subunit RFC4 [Coemansia sp. RSA 2618]KAJ2818063.1 Replication factor C, subunit RFC4 [Coemansia erecta]